MTRAEWLDYFETVNGRKPSVQEMADALKAGEFVNEAPAKTEDTATTEPIKVEAEIVETSTSPLTNGTSSNSNCTFYGSFSRRTSSYGKFGS
ncbi:MAG: hypothetical protein ACLS36_03825 [Streptococcus sp.]